MISKRELIEKIERFEGDNIETCLCIIETKTQCSLDLEGSLFRIGMLLELFGREDPDLRKVLSVVGSDILRNINEDEDGGEE